MSSIKKLLPHINQPSAPPLAPDDLQAAESLYEGNLCNVVAVNKNGVEYAAKMIKK